VSFSLDGEWYVATVTGVADETEAHAAAHVALMRLARRLNPTGTRILTETARDQLDAPPAY
jgi:hypothetical protein